MLLASVAQRGIHLSFRLIRENDIPMNSALNHSNLFLTVEEWEMG
jgi:hypothetical protein